jgi:hypothetical protein
MWRIPTSRNQTKIVQRLGRFFFHQIKVRQTIGRNDAIHAICNRLRRLEAFLYLADQIFNSFQKFKTKIKKIKNLYRLCPFPRHIHSHADLIWPASTLKGMPHEMDKAFVDIHGSMVAERGCIITSVADPGSGALLNPGSGIQNRFFPDPGSRIPNPYFWEHSDNFLSKKLYDSLKIGPTFFLNHFKN